MRDIGCKVGGTEMECVELFLDMSALGDMDRRTIRFVFVLVFRVGHSEMVSGTVASDTSKAAVAQIHST